MEVAVNIQADDNWDDSWAAIGQSALQEAVDDDPTITSTLTPAPPGSKGLGDLLLAITENALGSLLAQLATHLAILPLPRRPSTLRLSAAQRETNTTTQLYPPTQQVQEVQLIQPHATATLDIDLSEVYREFVRRQRQDDTSAATEDDDSTAQRIQRWVAVTVSNVQQAVIRIRIE